MKFFCLYIYIYWPKPHASQKAFSLSRCFVFRVFSHRDIILWVWDSVRESFCVLKIFSFCAKKWRLLLCSDLRLQLRLLSSRPLLHRPVGFPRLLFIITSLHHRFCIFFDSAFLFLNFVDFFFFFGSVLLFF